MNVYSIWELIKWQNKYFINRIMIKWIGYNVSQDGNKELALLHKAMNFCAHEVCYFLISLN